mmetsp:Transcript_106114/g.236784  ORF Transcript_106114/g.236784 Transcript_106114/m.236784 type:complete len:317 (+) Transcript_106114:1-951(+)
MRLKCAPLPNHIAIAKLIPCAGMAQFPRSYVQSDPSRRDRSIVVLLFTFLTALLLNRPFVLVVFLLLLLLLAALRHCRNALVGPGRNRRSVLSLVLGGCLALLLFKAELSAEALALPLHLPTPLQLRLLLLRERLDTLLLGPLLQALCLLEPLLETPQLPFQAVELAAPGLLADQGLVLLAQLLHMRGSLHAPVEHRHASARSRHCEEIWPLGDGVERKRAERRRFLPGEQQAVEAKADRHRLSENCTAAALRPSPQPEEACLADRQALVLEVASLGPEATDRIGLWARSRRLIEHRQELVGRRLKVPHRWLQRPR